VPSKIYVGNMSYSTTEDELRDLFAPYGEVVSVSVVYDRATGRPRGFAFVEMGTTEAAEGAISALNGQEVGGRQLRVNAAKPAGSEGRGGGGGRGGYGGGGGGGYGGGGGGGGRGYGGGGRDDYGGGGGRGGGYGRGGYESRGYSLRPFARRKD
jgi:cold-inducible RNA-binding protein